MQFDLSSPKINDLVKLFLSTAFGSIATFLAMAFLSQPALSGPVSIPILYCLKGKPAWSQLLLTLGLMTISNLIVSGVVGLLSFRKLSNEITSNLWGHAFNSAMGGIRWGFLNYVLWGTGSVFVLAFSSYGEGFSLQAFFTAATMGSVWHNPVCTVAYYYIGEVLLSDAQVSGLYSLRPPCAARLYLPAFLGSIGMGGILSYYAYIVGRSNLIRIIYLNKYQIAILLFVWFLIQYAFFGVADQKSFVNRAITFQNIISVWLIYFAVLVCGWMIGSEVFELILRTTLFVRT